MFDEIARGGMAVIHLGRMIGAGGFTRTVAIKRLHPEYARDPTFVDMFLDEAQIIARIRHPNVIPTINLVEEEGDLFIIMDYVEGINFSQLLRAAKRRSERPPLDVALRIVVGSLNGLHAAHDATDERGEPIQLVHRDVSPENVMVGIDGFARVLDFGVARALGRRRTSRQSSEVKGKVSSMAPEQVLGEPVDRRTDVFAASAMLWRALTGYRLFKAKTLADLTEEVLEMNIEPPSKFVPNLPRALDAVVVRGLERDPKRRWPDAAAMAEAIEAAARLAPHREVGRWVRRLGARRLSELAAAVSAMERRPVHRRPPGKRRVRKRSMLSIDESLLRQVAKEAGYDPDAPPLPEPGGIDGLSIRPPDVVAGSASANAKPLVQAGPVVGDPPAEDRSPHPHLIDEESSIDELCADQVMLSDEASVDRVLPSGAAAATAMAAESPAGGAAPSAPGPPALPTDLAASQGAMDSVPPASGLTDGEGSAPAPRHVSIRASSPFSVALVKRPIALFVLLGVVVLLVAVGLVALVLGTR